MKLRIVDYKKVSNRYTDIVVVSEDTKYKNIFPDTSSLTLELSKMKNVEFENFCISPFQLKAVQTKSVQPKESNSNTKDLNIIKGMLLELINRPDVNAVLQIQDDKNKIISLEQEVKRLSQNITVLRNQIVSLENNLNNNFSITQSLEESISDKIDELKKNVDPMYDIIVSKLNDKLIQEKAHKYPKCDSDLNTWRYKGLKREALNFEASITPDGIVYDSINSEEQCRSAFAEINLPTSKLVLNYNAIDILKCREYTEFFDGCRIIASKALSNDLNKKSELKVQSLDDSELTCTIAALNVSIMQSLRVVEDNLVDAKGNKMYVAGTLGAVFSVCLLFMKMLGKFGVSFLDFNGVNFFNVYNRAIHTNYGTSGSDSTLGLYGDEVLNTFDTKLQDDMKSYMVYSCRLFTTNTQKALIYNSEKLVRRYGVEHAKYVDIKKLPCYEFVKNTLVTSANYDLRLFMVYLIYCQQPYFGFKIKASKSQYKETLGRTNVVSGNNYKERVALFTILQNAYFSAKMMLLDVKDDDMIPREKRLDWLNSYDWIDKEESGYNRHSYYDNQKYLHIERFLEYLKLGICMQGVSPICADKLVQLFCDYGHIAWIVDEDYSERRVR